MSEDAPRPVQAAIRTELGAIFVSLKLSRRAWLVTSLSRAAGRRCRSIRFRPAISPACSDGSLSSRRKRERGRGGTSWFEAAIVPWFPGRALLSYC
jgi:hypothetical protein